MKVNISRLDNIDKKKFNGQQVFVEGGAFFENCAFYKCTVVLKENTVGNPADVRFKNCSLRKCHIVGKAWGIDFKKTTVEETVVESDMESPYPIDSEGLVVIRSQFGSEQKPIDLHGALFKGAVFKKVKVIGTLAGADFEFARLTDVDLSEASTVDVDFNGVRAVNVIGVTIRGNPDGLSTLETGEDQLSVLIKDAKLVSLEDAVEWFERTFSSYVVKAWEKGDGFYMKLSGSFEYGERVMLLKKRDKYLSFDCIYRENNSWYPDNCVH